MPDINEIELRRYKNQINAPDIGIEGQQKFKKSKVLIIGAGSMGTSVLQYLAAAGIGIVGICDFKTIQEANFANQIIYGLGDLGKLKTIVVKEKLQLLNPYISIQIHNIQIKEDNVEKICRDYDIIIDTTSDITLSSIILSHTNLPLISGIIVNDTGFIFSFHKKRVFPDKNINTNSSPFFPVGALSGTIGCLMAYQVLKIILYPSSFSDSIFSFNFKTFISEFKLLE